MGWWDWSCEFPVYKAYLGGWGCRGPQPDRAPCALPFYYTALNSVVVKQVGVANSVPFRAARRAQTARPKRPRTSIRTPWPAGAQGTCSRHTRGVGDFGGGVLPVDGALPRTSPQGLGQWLLHPVRCSTPGFDSRVFLCTAPGASKPRSSATWLRAARPLAPSTPARSSCAAFMPPALPALSRRPT